MKPAKEKTKKLRRTIKNATYSKSDYSSNDGMLTTVWGPPMWQFLHTMSFNYPDKPSYQDKTNYKNFVLSLQFILPCGKCRANFVKNLRRLPLKEHHMKSRATFSKYIYRLHETINKMLHKDSGLSYNDVRERYEHFRARCAKSHDELNADLHKSIPVETFSENSHGKELGCTEPLYGEKSKCVLQIVPQNKNCETFKIDNKCIKKRITYLNNKTRKRYTENKSII
jgi:hypothetical protein